MCHTYRLYIQTYTFVATSLCRCIFSKPISAEGCYGFEMEPRLGTLSVMRIAFGIFSYEWSLWFRGLNMCHTDSLYIQTCTFVAISLCRCSFSKPISAGGCYGFEMQPMLGTLSVMRIACGNILFGMEPMASWAQHVSHI